MPEPSGRHQPGRRGGANLRRADPPPPVMRSGARRAGGGCGWGRRRERRHKQAFGRRARGALAALSAVAVLAASAAVLVGAGPAGAAAPRVAVSNTGQPEGYAQNFNWDQAQAFTTGPDPDGYTLGAVRIGIDADTGAGPSYRVTIREADAAGAPADTALGTLTNPDRLAADGPSEFLAPPGGIALAADTTYFVVIDVRAAASTHQAWLAGNTRDVQVTDSDDIDPGGDDGWDIAPDAMVRLAWTTRAWQPRSAARQIAVIAYPTAQLAALAAAASGQGALMMEITGHALAADTAPQHTTDQTPDAPTAHTQQQTPPPNAAVEEIPPPPDRELRTAAQQQASSDDPSVTAGTRGTLVSNVDFDRELYFSSSNTGYYDYAQAFTTGGSRLDEFSRSVLTSVHLFFRHSSIHDETNRVSPELTVSVWTADDEGLPQRSIAVLSSPDGPLPDSSRFDPVPSVFAAPGAGVALEAETTYLLVLEFDDYGTYDLNFAETHDEHDLRTGWSISNHYLKRGYELDSSGELVTGSGPFEPPDQIILPTVLQLAVQGRPFGFLSDFGPHVSQTGQTHPGGCGGQPMPGLDADELFAGHTFFCDTRRGQWIRGRWPIPGIDYARDDQLLHPDDGDFPERCGGYNRYDPITDTCYFYGPNG